MANEGGNAFPTTVTDYVDDNGKQWNHYETGMTLRDWFAGQVVGVISNLKGAREGVGPAERLAEGAYMIADAMLKERERT